MRDLSPRPRYPAMDRHSYLASARASTSRKLRVPKRQATSTPVGLSSWPPIDLKPGRPATGFCPCGRQLVESLPCYVCCLDRLAGPSHWTEPRYLSRLTVLPRARAKLALEPSRPVSAAPGPRFLGLGHKCSLWPATALYDALQHRMGMARSLSAAGGTRAQDLENLSGYIYTL
jgi:hypothetical protein